MGKGYALLVLGLLGQRSRSQGHHIENPCLDNNSSTTVPRFTKFYVKVALVSRMFPIGFGAPDPKVKVTEASYGKTLSRQ